MGMFDTFRTLLRCPLDDTDIDDWQGKDGPCSLLTFRPGSPFVHAPAVFADQAPGGQELPVTPDLLPERFELVARHPTRRREHFLLAIGFRDEDGLWRRTELVGVYTWRGSGLDMSKHWLWSAELANLREVAAALGLAVDSAEMRTIAGHTASERDALMAGVSATTSRYEHLGILRAFVAALAQHGPPSEWFRSPEPASHIGLLRNTAKLVEALEQLG